MAKKKGKILVGQSGLGVGPKEKIKSGLINIGSNTQDIRLIDPTGKEIFVPAGAGKIHMEPEDKARLELFKKDPSVADFIPALPVYIATKRQPLMADRLLASKLADFPLVHKDQERIRGYLMESKRFVLDNNGAAYMAEIIRENPKMIARDVEFAIPPFPNMYVEIPFLTLYKEITGRDPDETADATVGYLFHGPHVFVITSGRDDSPPLIMPWYYWLNKTWTLQEEIKVAEFLETSRGQIDLFFWGESIPKLTEEEARVFRAHHSMWMMRQNELEDEFIRQMWRTVYDTSAGDLRNIIAAILLLNRSGNVRYDQQFGPHRAMIRNKPRAFLSHTVVKFRLNPVKRVIKGGRGLGAWRVRHDVKGHWCHDKIARMAQEPGASCRRDEFNDPTHDWNEYGINEWACVKCKGKRWWRKACKRGTREKGVAKATYEVTE